jgi:tetratricopeptide (TPR) repeat protein
VKIRPGHLPSLLALANLVASQPRYKNEEGRKEAKALYQDALDAANTESGRLHVLCAYANYLFAVRDPAAETRYKEALEISACDATVCYNYALLLHSLPPTRPQEAERLYKRALKSDPGHLPTLVNYAVLLQEVRNDAATAQTLYLKVLETAVKKGTISLSFIRSTPNSPPPSLRSPASTKPRPSQGGTPSRTCTMPPPAERKDGDGGGGGMGDRAVPAVPRAVVTALVNYAQLLQEREQDVVSAEECLREAVRVQPEHVSGRVALASLLNANGDAPEAEKELKTALKMSPMHCGALCAYAALLEGEYQEYDKAEALYKTALQLPAPRPDTAPSVAVAGGQGGRVTVLCRYAALLALVRHDYAGAEVLLDEALALDPSIKGAAAFERLLQEKQLAAAAAAAARTSGHVGSDCVEDLVLAAGTAAAVAWGGAGGSGGGADMDAVSEWFAKSLQAAGLAEEQEVEQVATERVRKLEGLELQALARVRAAEEAARERIKALALASPRTTTPVTPTTPATPKLSEDAFAAAAAAAAGAGVAGTSASTGMGLFARGSAALFGAGSEASGGKVSNENGGSGGWLDSFSAASLGGLGDGTGQGSGGRWGGVFAAAVAGLGIAPGGSAHGADAAGPAFLRSGAQALGAVAAAALPQTAALFGLPQTSAPFSLPATPLPSQEKGAALVLGEEEREEEEEEEEVDAVFAPAIAALPPEVAVTTGEEDEEEELSLRARLFRFDEAGKDWKERGLGVVKILRHSISGLSSRRPSCHRFTSLAIASLAPCTCTRAWMCCVCGLALVGLV